MRGFRQRAAVADVLALIDSRTATLPGEPVPILAAAGRVLAEAVTAAVNVPNFAKAAMDGFAVCAADTRGATLDTPVALTLIGDALPARPFAGEVKPGQAVRIMTGAPVPAGSDAVLMAEAAQLQPDGLVLAGEAVPPGKHIICVGEDVAKGSAVLAAGRVLRAQDVGLLASIGTATIHAVRKPRVAILVTGNEILPPGSMPEGFRIVDSNSPMLAALATRDGAVVLPVRYVIDDYAMLRDAILQAAVSADVILISGGTSVGAEDHAPRVVAELGELAVHGVALRPASPLGVGFLLGKSGGEGDLKSGGEGVKGRKGEEEDRRGVEVEGKSGEEDGQTASRPSHPFTPSALHPQSSAPLLFLIPGNPVSCLCAYDLFAGRAFRRLGGRSGELPYRKRTLPLAGDIRSVSGRVDYVRVRVEGEQIVPLATAGASNLSSAVVADGFVLVPHDRDQLPPGECADVWLYDE